MFLSRFTSRRARLSSPRAISRLSAGHAARRRLRLESLEERLTLSVTAVELAKLTASDGQAEDYFGIVALSGDGNTIAVGANRDDDHGLDSGSAYVYRFDGTSWQETKLTASDGQAGDRLGESISISADGNVIAVGAPWHDGYGPDSGAAYVYRFNGTTWQETKLTASDSQAGDYFGQVAISADGHTIAVSAPWDDDHGPESGSAYVYRFDGTSWQETKLTASDGHTWELFGEAVSISADGSTIVVGADEDDDHGPRTGSAYVYRFDGTTWQETKITASDGQAEDKFGDSISISADGSTIAVGKYNDDDHGPNSGSAYVYHFDGTSWQETKLTASDSQAGDRFGIAVSVSSDGNMIAVGSWEDDDHGVDSGSVYVYYFDGTTWQETKFTASDGSAGDVFGAYVSVSSDGNMIAVGALWDDDNGFASGSVYVFGLYSDIEPPQLSVPEDQSLLEDTPSGLLAISVQDAGTDPDDIEVVASSSNQALIPDGNLTLGGSGTNRTLDILPSLDQNSLDPVFITITATDPSGNTTTATFSVVVTPVNDAPSFTLAGDQTVSEDAGAQSVAGFAGAISAGPSDESGQALTFLVTTDNPGLFSQAPAIDPLTGTLTYTPAANLNGTAAVQVLLQDNGGTANGGADTSGMAIFTIHVQSAAEQLAGLADAVQQLVNDEVLNTGQGNALAAKLAPKNNAQAQIGATTAFIHQVEALRQAGVLTDAEANALVAAAAELLNSLGNGLGSPSARRLAARDHIFAGLATATLE